MPVLLLSRGGHEDTSRCWDTSHVRRTDSWRIGRVCADSDCAESDRTDHGAPTTGGIEEVTVSARYREENLQQTPLAISAITAEDIEQRGFTNSSDIAYAVPNASFRQAQAAFGNTETAYIRGVGQNDFNFAFEPGVAIYVR